MTFKPDLSKGLEVFVDSDFARNWDKSESKDHDTARSCYGYIIKYHNCPLVWNHNWLEKSPYHPPRLNTQVYLFLPTPICNTEGEITTY
jgi:hypothetical protein